MKTKEIIAEYDVLVKDFTRLKKRYFKTQGEYRDAEQQLSDFQQKYLRVIETVKEA